MKKKILLVLITALLCAGLIMSCGGDDGTKKHTVTFEKNTTDTVTGMPDAQSVEDGKKASKPSADPVRTDRSEFIGWYADADCKTEWNFTTKTITGPTTIYAGWYTIGGNLGNITAKNSDTQKGWCTNGTDDIETDLNIVTLVNAKSLVLVLKAAPTGGVHLIWQADGNDWDWIDTSISSNSGVFDTSMTEWDEETLTVTIDLTKALDNYSTLADSYKAKFFIAYYSPNFNGLGIVSADLVEKTDIQGKKEFVFVTLNSDGGNFGTVAKPEATKVVRVVKGETIGKQLLPDPVKAGSNLVKWVDANDTQYYGTEAINADITLKAIWDTGDPALHTVTFNTTGGSDIAAVEVPHNARIDTKFPANPTREGWSFDGWVDENDVKFTKNTIISDDIEVFAKWKAGWANGKVQLDIVTPDEDKFSGQPAWYLNEFLDKFTSESKAYLVFELEACDVDDDGYLGGAAIILQYAPGWAWNDSTQTTIGNVWCGKEAGYIVIDLTACKSWEAFRASGNGKVVLGQWGGKILTERPISLYLTNLELNVEEEDEVVTGITYFKKTTVWP